MIIDMVEFGFALWWVKDFPISAEVIVLVVRICLQWPLGVWNTDEDPTPTWWVDEASDSFCVRDANGQTLVYVSPLRLRLPLPHQQMRVNYP